MTHELILKEIQSEFKLIERLIDESPDNSHLKRIMVRSVFSGIEAFASAILEFSKLKRSSQILKSMTAHSNHQELHKEFFEICALNNMDYKIDDNGEIKISPLRTRLKDRVVFALKVLGKSTANEINPKAIEGWDEFVKAIKVRNRVTHPKSFKDLEILDQEYESIIKAFQWMIRCNHRATGGKTY